MQHIFCDAVVVGAGPAGASAARACANAGIDTLIVERKKLPRHKACSGILIPDSIRIISEYFGHIPRKVRALPFKIEAMRMHFPGGRIFDIPFSGMFVHRNLFDLWLCEKSGAKTLDSTTLVSFAEKNGGVELLCRRPGEPELLIKSRVMIAADGGYSKIAYRIDSERYRFLSWYTALQETFECSADLEPGYFHFYAMPDISPYPSAYLKDGLVIMEVISKKGKNPQEMMAKFRRHLLENNSAGEIKPLRRLKCPIAYSAAQDSFCFGTERILVAGEASGLLNIFGEGISSALASGSIAGRSAARGIRFGFSPGSLYKKDIQVEKNRTLRQFYLKTLISGTVPTFNWKKGIQSAPWGKRLFIFTDLLRWYIKLKKS